MKISLPAALLIPAMLGGCATAPIVPLPRAAPETVGEVVVFRERAFAAGGVGLTVGDGRSAFALLGNGEKVRALFPPGEREIFVQARSAEASRVRVVVRTGATVCLRTSSSPSTYAKVLVPITLIATGYHFYLDEVACPTHAELAKYKDVVVRYE